MKKKYLFFGLLVAGLSIFQLVACGDAQAGGQSQSSSSAIASSSADPDENYKLNNEEFKNSFDVYSNEYVKVVLKNYLTSFEEGPSSTITYSKDKNWLKIAYQASSISMESYYYFGTDNIYQYINSGSTITSNSISRAEFNATNNSLSIFGADFYEKLTFNTESKMYEGSNIDINSDFGVGTSVQVTMDLKIKFENKKIVKFDLCSTTVSGSTSITSYSRAEFEYTPQTVTVPNDILEYHNNHNN